MTFDHQQNYAIAIFYEFIMRAPWSTFQVKLTTDGHEGEDKDQDCDISGDGFINIDVEIIIFIIHLTISSS